MKFSKEGTIGETQTKTFGFINLFVVLISEPD
jgi:hypothetical protein